MVHPSHAHQMPVIYRSYTHCKPVTGTLYTHHICIHMYFFYPWCAHHIRITHPSHPSREPTYPSPCSHLAVYSYIHVFIYWYFYPSIRVLNRSMTRLLDQQSSLFPDQSQKEATRLSDPTNSPWKQVVFRFMCWQPYWQVHCLHKLHVKVWTPRYVLCRLWERNA